MLESTELTTLVPAPPRRVYDAWLSSEEHSAFTGGEATVDPTVGGRHTAWGDYIEGVTLELEPYQRIVQSWRTADFPPGSADSRLELLLDDEEGETRLTLRHTGIPAGQAQDYEQGWREYYFAPMSVYFANRG